MKTTIPTYGQKEVLNYMRSFLAVNDCLPTSRAIQARFGWASRNAAVNVLKALEKKGHIERNELGRYRFRRVYIPNESVLHDTQ